MWVERRNEAFWLSSNCKSSGFFVHMRVNRIRYNVFNPKINSIKKYNALFYSTASHAYKWNGFLSSLVFD